MFWNINITVKDIRVTFTIIFLHQFLTKFFPLCYWYFFTKFNWWEFFYSHYRTRIKTIIIVRDQIFSLFFMIKFSPVCYASTSMNCFSNYFLRDFISVLIWQLVGFINWQGWHSQLPCQRCCRNFFSHEKNACFENYWHLLTIRMPNICER